MFDSEALTKIQSIILIAIIVVAAVGGVAIYVLDGGGEQSSETIKIGLLEDLDGVIGRPNWQAAILAVEEINAEGGILGREVKLIGEDHDGGLDSLILTTALTKLITTHKVDFIVGGGSGQAEFLVQDAIAQHKIVYISGSQIPEEITQRVLDNYEKYKYYFNHAFNATSVMLGIADGVKHIRDLTGFNKIGYLAEDWARYTIERLDDFLPENGFELVYKGKIPDGTVDFSSYFAQAEAAGVEVLFLMIASDAGIPFVKEYYDRQSPMVVYGGLLGAAGVSKSWENTGGKCEYITTLVQPVTAGYPLTSETLPFRDSYIDRWGETPLFLGAAAYDIIRFILFDAIKRAGTTETEAVIGALEETQVETSLAKNFVFTSNHDVLYSEGMISDRNGYGHPSILFQWQENATLVPIYPMWIMEEAGATYTFPDWPGPWD